MGGPVRLFHLLASHDPASPTGVPRFSGYFRRAFPDTLNVTPGTVGAIEWKHGDVVVTDNGLSLLVPDAVRTIVVHHGCAATHYDRDYSWRNETTEKMVQAQNEMFCHPNRTFVAPSAWVAAQFRKIAPKGYEPRIVPHHVPVIERRNFRLNPGGPTKADEMKAKIVGSILGVPAGKPQIIGDFRNLNKGSGLIDKYREAMPQYEFRQLDFPGGDDAKREAFYRSADVYLCVSLSEGAPYAVADAEAASLPIVSTVCGNVAEFPPEDFYAIMDRADVDAVANAIRAAVQNGRRAASFYRDYTFEVWQRAWREIIGA